MGEEAGPAPKRRATGDLKRVAEIVMVLSAMGEMRGGRDPVAVERALAAEARERLAAACEDVKPKDLFSREAVRVLVEDLGLNRSKDPLMGFRPPRMSIAEKLLLTKRKMEESKELSAHSSVYSSQLLPMGFSANPESHGTSFQGGSRFLPDKPSPMPLSAGGFQTASPVVYASQLSSAASSLKQSQMNEAQASVTPIKSSNNPLERDSSSFKLPNAEPGHFRLDTQTNGAAFSTQVRATSSVDFLPERNPTTSIQSTSAAAVKLNQTNKLADHSPTIPEGANEVNSVITTTQQMREQGQKTSVPQVSPVNLLIGHQAPHSLTFVHPTPLFTNHNEIAKTVQRVLQQKVSDRPSWTPPSSDYMNTPINCQICKVTITDVESLLICDHCERGTHLKCLQSYINKGIIPKADWHCPKCLNASNGKPLPPKYGRVTRTAGVSKGSSNSSATHPSLEKRAEMTESKVNSQKPVPTGNPALPHLAHASNICSSDSQSAPDLKMCNAREMQGSNFPTNGMKKEDEMHSESFINRSKEKIETVGVTLGAQSETTNKQIDKNGLSPCDEQISTSETKLQPECVSDQFPSEHPSGTVIENTCQTQVPGDHLVGKTSMPIINEGSYSPLHEIRKCDDDMEKVSESREFTENDGTSNLRQDNWDDPQATLNGAFCNADGAGFSGRPSPSDLHTVDWIGDILQVIEEKTFYQSCRINGILHKLQDHVLISLNSQNVTPSKLHTLWEDNNNGSKWAIVSPYYFPNELPGVVSHPSTPENNEVYASNKESTIVAGSIHGHCKVLFMDKPGEKCDIGNHLGNRISTSNPVFLCRWKYDESKCTFQPTSS